VEVKARSVVRVIIAGEWIWVEPGTFEVTDFTFCDDDGNVINRSKEPAYHFISTNGDPYFGPLAAIQLIKLRPPELDVTQDSAKKREAHELPAAGESGDGAQRAPAADEQADAAASEAQAEVEEVPTRRKVSADELFADPIPDPVGEAASGGGRGLL
jgi:hypothetical protein